MSKGVIGAVKGKRPSQEDIIKEVKGICLKFQNGEITKDEFYDRMDILHNTSAISEKDSQRVQARIDEINAILENYPEEKKRTTYAIALVRTKEGKTEMWISSAGRIGKVRSEIRGDDKLIQNKIPAPPADKENRLNDAEQTLMREAEEKEAEILAMGATRYMCKKCQEVADSKNLLHTMVTPLKE